MSSIRIQLDNNHYINNKNEPVFTPGQPIAGSIICSFNTNKTIDVIKIELEGKGQTGWDEPHVSSTPTNNILMFYSGTETYLNKEIILLRGPIEVAAGTHFYPFSYTLPSRGLPQSYETCLGYIRYSIKATIARSFTTLCFDDIPLFIHTPFDLNQLPHLRNPVTVTADRTLRYCCIINSGILTFNISLPKSGFVPGEDISISGYIKNLTNVDMKTMEFKIVEDSQFIAHTPTSRTKYSKRVLASRTENGVGAHGEKSWTLTLKIPKDAYPQSESCTIMKISYKLKVKLLVPSPHRNLNNEVPLVIGSIPLTDLSSDSLPSVSDLAKDSEPSNRHSEAPPPYEHNQITKY